MIITNPNGLILKYVRLQNSYDELVKFWESDHTPYLLWHKLTDNELMAFL